MVRSGRKRDKDEAKLGRFPPREGGVMTLSIVMPREGGGIQ
jgi:hypothetical protein